MKTFITIIFNLIILLGISEKSCAQFNSQFFPDFQAYPGNPIINYGDGFADATWNDPCVLKINGQYVMYATSAVGIILSDSNTVKVYRHVSSDGINWTLSPTTPVMQPALGTYYQGGTETPSVVIKDSIYHMYLTCYPPGNNQDEFVIAHATSNNGLSWVMDSVPVIESDGSSTFYGLLVGEPGAMVYNDSIYLFFTAAGIVNSQVVQAIGIMKSSDGTNFTIPDIAVQLPQNVYPAIDNYWGLSTPSALAINDTIYLFTDVARFINGEWTQVALHQFKKYANSGVWYHDTIPIHTMQDFTWTDGDYLSTLLAPTPLLDDNGVLKIWYAGYRIADVNGNDTLYYVYFDSQGFMHINPDNWGIGMSSYQFPLITNTKSINKNELSIFCYPNPAQHQLYIATNKATKNAILNIYDISNQLIDSKIFYHFTSTTIQLNSMAAGTYFIELISENEVVNKKVIITK